MNPASGSRRLIYVRHYPLLRGLLLALPVAIFSCNLNLQSASTTTPPVVENFLKWQDKQEANLLSYTARRKYTLRATEKDQFAVAEVEMVYDKSRGESFKVMQWKGAGGLYKFVLQRALDSEVDLMRPQNKMARLITDQNYQFNVQGLEQCKDRSCYSIHITPRRKLSALLEGNIWVDAETFGLLRIEGRTVSGSFWAGQPAIAQEFCPVKGFQLLQKSDLRTKARGLGETVLNIEVLSQQISN